MRHIVNRRRRVQGNNAYHYADGETAVLPPGEKDVAGQGICLQSPIDLGTV